MTLIPYDAQTLFGVPLLVWLIPVAIAVWLRIAWVQRRRDDD
ncbi:hypothetical protein [Rubrimonas cliftonensis]|uniref:Uncharacterized protein n=1 Tax=Rubrimonas cliftonensis TaxID=89524 RepID=A0A1H3YRN2_9RHOB|nr:hypothetical protein [Rubrimonas cliftonensis]SEA14067.1 hypothetical protein SAMN05444370_103214 [Rubrimonas cliftonensis]